MLFAGWNIAEEHDSIIFGFVIVCSPPCDRIDGKLIEFPLDDRKTKLIEIESKQGIRKSSAISGYLRIFKT